MAFEALKQFFGEDGTASINYETLSKGITEKGMRLADLSLGEYVSKDKFDEQTRKFNEYKTAHDEKKYADYDDIKKELAMYKAKEADRELMTKLSDNKVKAEFQKFVLSEVKALVTDQKTFDKAMTEYLTANPQYVVKENPAPFYRASSVPLENGGGQTPNTAQRMNALLRGVRK